MFAVFLLLDAVKQAEVLESFLEIEETLRYNAKKILR